MFELVDHRLGCRCNGGGHCGGAAEVIALQQIHAQTDDGAQLGLGLNALGNELHTAGVGVSHNVGDDLLLVTVGIDPAHNGNVDLDIPGRELQQVQFVAVAAAVVIQRKGAGEARNVPLPFQTCAVQIFLFGDLHHQPLEQLGVGAEHIPPHPQPSG